MSKFVYSSVAAVLAAGAIAGSLDAGPAAPPAAPALFRVATLADTALGDFQNAYLPGSIANDRAIRMGSLGSDIFHAQTDATTEFWAVTDRGPNGQPTVNGSSRRTFAVPEFNPVILHAKVQGERVEILNTIPIVNDAGHPVTGLPNIATYDETPYQFDAQAQLVNGRNPDGLDTEGIVRTPDGDFWLVDEYSPSLIHVSATGHVIRRFVPQGLPLAGANYEVSYTLPGILTKRRQNRGFEGLALSPDGATLFLGMQSPLENPTRALGRASRNVRVFRFDVSSEQVTGEFVYRLDEVCAFLSQPAGCGVAPGDMKLSSLYAVSATKLLIDERTDDVAKVYAVDLSDATNILGTQWDVPRSSSSDPALETLAGAALESLVAAKSLVVDLSTVPGMPKKIEGIALVNPEVLAVANDNDFGLVDTTTFDAAGKLSNDTGVKSQILFVRLAHPIVR